MKFLIILFSVLVLSEYSSAFVAKSKRQGGCSSGQFSCGPGARLDCIPETWLCDGDNDCGDGSDERPDNCGGCPSGQFQCGPGANRPCIPESWKCDGDNDCGDGSDEDNCGDCPSGQFQCGPGANRRCIPEEWKCDGDNDCGDGSDERQENCAGCPSGQFQCGPGASRPCITERWKCDGDNDCGDGSDEDNCDSSCPSGQFRCSGSGRCIPQTWLCDGDNDCGDNSDENPAQCENGGQGGQGGPPGQQCATSLQMCVMPIASQFQGMQGPQFLQLIRSTPLPQLCEPLIQAHECVSGALETQCSSLPPLQGNLDAANAIRATGVAIDFVCREHVDELEETKNCIIDNAYQIASANQQCMGGLNPATALDDMQCPPPRLGECAQDVITEHCGDRSGQLISELGGLVLNEMGCSKKKLKRKHLTKKGMDLKILKKAFKWMF